MPPTPPWGGAEPSPGPPEAARCYPWVPQPGGRWARSSPVGWGSAAGAVRGGKRRRETPGRAGKRGWQLLGCSPLLSPNPAGCCAPPSGCPRPRPCRCRGAAEPEGCVGGCWQQGRPRCGHADPREGEGRQGSQPRSGVFLGEGARTRGAAGHPKHRQPLKATCGGYGLQQRAGSWHRAALQERGSTQRCWWVSPRRSGRWEDRGRGAPWEARAIRALSRCRGGSFTNCIQPPALNRSRSLGFAAGNSSPWC